VRFPAEYGTPGGPEDTLPWSTLEIPERLCPEFCVRAGVVHRADATLLAESTADVA
jgi:hypothetical protein